ncbi:S9 family peptidase [Bacillus sp. EAC]|uniref:alpha/beta hydrolase family protein n=1 Tax=Bacillus sp. EAC TaxID=1978338 RepID=UPI0015C502A2|nr:alpha/beta hydrolase [Bacillus sp. EAC]
MENRKRINPSILRLLKIPSGNDVIVGRMYLAEGEGPHGTVLLLHGFPGGMLNLDLASELQQEGWNVLVMNYRGAWGSQGTFSFSNSIEDVLSALKYLKESEVAKENRIDTKRIGLIGHSFGGFLALKVASMEPSIHSVASLSGANFGLFAQMVEQDPSFEAQIREVLKEGAFFLKGASAESIMEEVLFNQIEWNTFLYAPLLLKRNILLTAADFDEEIPKVYFHDPLVDILEKAGANHLQTKVFETDHNYLNHRKELAQTLHNWLDEVL